MTKKNYIFLNLIIVIFITLFNSYSYSNYELDISTIYYFITNSIGLIGVLLMVFISAILKISITSENLMKFISIIMIINYGLYIYILNILYIKNKKIIGYFLSGFFLFFNLAIGIGVFI